MVLFILFLSLNVAVNAEPIPDNTEIKSDILRSLPRDSYYKDVVILTDESPDTTISSTDAVMVYGSAGTNHITLESGSSVQFINIPGSNTIDIDSDSGLFTVSRSGATVTFRGNDGTLLVMPSTCTPQSINFQDMSSDLIIESGAVNFGGQTVSPDNVLLGYTITQLTFTGGYYAYDNMHPQLNQRGEIAFVRDMDPARAVSDPEIFLYSNGTITQISNNFRSVSTDPYYTNFKLNDNADMVWIDDDEGVQLYSNGITSQIAAYRSFLPDLNNNGQIVFKRASDASLMLYDNGVTNAVISSENNWVPDRPKINDAGQIFFEQTNVGYWTTRPSEIFLLENGVSTRLTDDYVRDNFLVAGNNGQAVWINDKDGDPSEIYLYAHGTAAKITDASNNGMNTPVHEKPDINDFGDAVWPAQGDIWLYSNGVTTRISTDDTNGNSVKFPRINNYGLIVWVTTEEGGNNNLYCYYKGIITKIDAGNYGPSSSMLPQINDRGQIAWADYDTSSGWEIFLATPTAGPDLINE